jgi:hypothetical protein
MKGGVAQREVADKRELNLGFPSINRSTNGNRQDGPWRGADGPTK